MLAYTYIKQGKFSLFAVLLVEILLLNSFSIIEFCIFGQAFWNLFQKRKY